MVQLLSDRGITCKNAVRLAPSTANAAGKQLKQEKCIYCGSRKIKAESPPQDLREEVIKIRRIDV